MVNGIYSFFILGLVIALIFVTLYLYKKTISFRISNNSPIKILSQVMLGSKERLVLLKINNETILLGVTSHQISTLHVCPSLKDSIE